MTRSLTLAFVAALALAACGQDEGRGGLTAEEERQLDNAAQMLDENVFDASPDSMVANAAELEAIDASEGGAEANAGTDANAQ